MCYTLKHFDVNELFRVDISFYNLKQYRGSHLSLTLGP